MDWNTLLMVKGIRQECVTHFLEGLKIGTDQCVCVKEGKPAVQDKHMKSTHEKLCPYAIFFLTISIAY